MAISEVHDSIAWLGNPESRILSIRKFRQHINNLPLSEAVKLTQFTWKNSPKINKSLIDIVDIDNWPTPWQLFGQSFFCEDLQQLGVFYTLILSDHAKHINLMITDHVIEGITANVVTENNLPSGSVLAIITENDITEKLGV